ncbi:ABC transporter permease [Nonomuraea bangladeshensis]|uniref:ABC transporter permease n=1 Tax=Nonomuraea bangladeshensis TaxID=404385 RepID=UPI0031D400C3
MIRNPLVRAELVKARAGRTGPALAVIAPVTCAVWAALQVLVFDGLSDVPETARVENVYAMAQQAYVFTLILGVLAMTGEYRHQTITWTFLVTPVRSRVVSAKLMAWGLVGLAVACVSALATLASGAVLLAVRGLPVLTPGVPLVLLGAVLSTAAYALLGVGLGALIRNQVVALVVALLWFMYGDYMLTSVAPDVGRWLPTGAARALSGMHLQAGALLPAWAGGLLFAAYVAAAALAARLVTLRRDVT